MTPVQERFFYHSFPRPRPSDHVDTVTAKGLRILESIKTTGLIVAPEIVTWKQPLINGTDRITRLRQKRISFTELSRDEVPDRGKKFGPFSLEFKIDVLRGLGALPVIYMPQSLKPSGDLSVLGAAIVTHLRDVAYTIKQLDSLSKWSDPQYVLANMHLPPNVISCDPNWVINLNSLEPDNSAAATRPAPAKFVRDVIDFISFKNAPFEYMSGVLHLMQTLFYPTDDNQHDDLLSYYRQREWRIAAGLIYNGVAHGRSLSETEKSQLCAIDPRFWCRDISDDDGTFRRIDETVVIDHVEGRPVSEFLSAILVPSPAYERAKSLFGGAVVDAGEYAGDEPDRGAGSGP